MDALVQQIRPNALKESASHQEGPPKKAELWLVQIPLFRPLIFLIAVQGRSPTGGHKPSGNAPRLFGPGDGRLRGNREDAVIAYLAQCPAAKLPDQLP